MKKSFLCYLGLLWTVWSVQAQTRGLFVPTANGQTEPASQEKRIALVIGNETYRGGGWGLLSNPVNDAMLMATTLRQVGFEVLSVSNGTKDQMLAGIEQLVGKVSGKQTVALVFYAGHGVEAEGKNWLVPVTDKTKCRTQISMNCISLDYILQELQNAGTAFNVLISDACRDNTLPFTCPSVGRNGSQSGFVEYKAKGSCIAFSTAPNKVALDGPKGGNSPYTAALARAIAQGVQPVEEVFKQVSRELDALGQEPWVHSAFLGNFYFKMPAAPAVQPTAKRDFTETATGVSFSMKYLAGNSFQMGSTDSDAYDSEKPVHTVRVGEFYMGKYEVTVGEYLKFCQATNSNWPDWLEKGSDYHVETGSNKYYFEKGYRRTGSENLPIVGVSWDNAVAYCKWLSSITGKTYRLPTEAEWEYSARGGESFKYAGSNDLNTTAWNGSNSDSKTHPVGQKQANGFGLYDMSGNVLEWCGDYFGDYNSNSQSNPIGAVSGSNRVIRGGSWSYDAQNCRVSFRNSDAPTGRDGSLGFRVACLSQ